MSEKELTISNGLTVYFSLDDLLHPAIEKELVKRGWTKGRYEVTGMKPELKEQALLGMHVTLTRTA